MKRDKYNYGEENNLNLKLVVAIHRSLQKGERCLAELLIKKDLTIPQFGVLEAIYHGGPMNINQIISKTLSTSGNMTVVIRNLVKAGLIEKTRDPDDGRAFQIKLTEKGSEMIEELFPTHLLDLKETFGGLEIEEKRELLRLLKKMNGYEK